MFATTFLCLQKYNWSSDYTFLFMKAPSRCGDSACVYNDLSIGKAARLL